MANLRARVERAVRTTVQVTLLCSLSMIAVGWCTGNIAQQGVGAPFTTSPREITWRVWAEDIAGCALIGIIFGLPLSLLATTVLVFGRDDALS